MVAKRGVRPPTTRGSSGVVVELGGAAGVAQGLHTSSFAWSDLASAWSWWPSASRPGLSVASPRPSLTLPTPSWILSPSPIRTSELLSGWYPSCFRRYTRSFRQSVPQPCRSGGRMVPMEFEAELWLWDARRADTWTFLKRAAGAVGGDPRPRRGATARRLRVGTGAGDDRDIDLADLGLPGDDGRYGRRSTSPYAGRKASRPATRCRFGCRCWPTTDRTAALRESRQRDLLGV